MDIKELTKKIVTVSDTYAKVCKVNRDNDWYVLKLQEELGELIQSYLSFTNRGRSRGKTEKVIKENFADELADVIGHILLAADHFDIDIEKALKRKWFKYLK
jgi:NTP pyrophosphatase (non-canonical NTP hydrolase)